MNDTTTSKLYDAVFEQYALLARAIIADNLLDITDVKAEKALFQPRKVKEKYSGKAGHCAYVQSHDLTKYLKELKQAEEELLGEKITITADGFTCSFIRENVFEYKARLDELMPPAKRKYLTSAEVKP